MTLQNIGGALARFLKAVNKTLNPALGHEYLDMIKSQIEDRLTWVANEPYSAVLYPRVLETVEDELTTFWRMGKLKGLEPENAFFARCDDGTMTAADVAAHRIVCLVGVATVTSGEFILFDVVQTAR